MSQIAIYAGWYADDACGPFATAESRVHARRVRVSSAFVQRHTLRSTTQALVRPAAGQRRDLHHGLRV